MPSPLLRLRGGAPSLCIGVSALITLALVQSQSLDRLMALSVLASLLQHLASSLACWKLRGWRSWPGIPQLAVCVCLGLLLTSSHDLLIGIGISILIGALLTRLGPRPPLTKGHGS